MSSYPSNVNYIIDGEPVTANVTNRPIRQTAERTDALRKQLDAASLGQALFLYHAPVESLCTVGMPVYWNQEYSWFSPAVAHTDSGCCTGTLNLDPSAEVIGIIYEKPSQNSATIVTFGVVDFPDFRAVVGENTGRFYLGYTPGSVTFSTPAMDIPLGTVLGGKDACDTGFYVYICPECVNQRLSHVHIQHTLISDNWITASGVSGAPEDATYKYDLAQDAELTGLFPPVPVNSASFNIDWNETAPGAKLVDFIKVNHAGIWWCSSESPFTSDHPGAGAFQITMEFSRVRLDTRNQVVTSIRPDTDSPIHLEDCAGNTATSGDLYLSLALPDPEDATTLTGSAVQSIANDLCCTAAPVINGIRSGSSNLSVSGTNQFTTNGVQYHKGLITLTQQSSISDYEIAPSIVRLEGALESVWNHIPYLAMPHTRDNAIYLKFEIPGNFSDNASFVLRTLCFAPIAGTWPAMSTSYMRIPRPSSPGISETCAPWLGFTSAGTLGGAIAVTMASILELALPSIAVAGGDTLILKLSRTASTGYASDTGILRINGIINEEVS